jgi:hypothetical protein
MSRQPLPVNLNEVYSELADVVDLPVPQVARTCEGLRCNPDLLACLVARPATLEEVHEFDKK